MTDRTSNTGPVALATALHGGGWAEGGCTLETTDANGTRKTTASDCKHAAFHADEAADLVSRLTDLGWSVSRLAAPDPAPVREALATDLDRLEAMSWDDSQAPEGGRIAEGVRFAVGYIRAALAARPALSAQIPDEDLPGYRQPFTGPLGSRGDPTVALAAPSGDVLDTDPDQCPTCRQPWNGGD